MTEEEWLACADPEPMLMFLKGKASNRKLWQLGLATLRQVSLHDRFEDWKSAIVAGDAILDDPESRPHIVRIHRNWSPPLNLQLIQWVMHAVLYGGLLSHHQSREENLTWRIQEAIGRVARAITFEQSGAEASEIDPTTSSDHAANLAWRRVRASQASLLRDIFPFRPITLDPSWLTSTVVALAQQMHDSRDFSAMPILADALQDSGCDNEALLNHCRGPGPHVRGRLKK